MRIDSIAKERTGDGARVSARVEWERSGKVETVYFQVGAGLADDIACDPNAFLTACCLPAMFAGEERIRVEGAVCPVLLDGLRLNMRTFRHWNGSRHLVPAVEAEVRPAGNDRQNAGTTGLFLSGGLDSLFSLRKNRMNVPMGSRGSAEYGILVNGFDISYNRNPDHAQVFDRAVAALQAVVEESGLTLIPVHTNIRLLNNEVGFWMHWFHGAALAAVAHVLSCLLSRVIVASSHCIDNLEPWGSHPLIDPNYGSARLQVVHDQLWPRYEKTAFVSGWQTALDNVRVCTSNPKDQLNCGQCVACVKTMTHLLALGKLGQAGAFASKDISARKFREVCQLTSLPDIRVHYLPILEQLRARGREDLAEVVRSELGRWSRMRRSRTAAALRDFDRKRLRGCVSGLFSLARRIASRAGGGRSPVRAT